MEELDKFYIRIIAILFGELSFVFLFFAVLWFANLAEIDLPTEIRIFWWALLFLISIAVIILRRSLFSWKRLKDIAIRKNIAAVSRTLYSNTLVLSLMAWAVALIGFLIAFMSGDKFGLLRSTIISLLLFAVIFPRRTSWQNILLNLQKTMNS
ncbi:MAG: hypothetical protein D6735_10750 [Acidobacteria bacterium]|nr:MAG: hypothetical protein D6735_10750 [Acidobacteriota bacterium]